jgi:MFS family permease
MPPTFLLFALVIGLAVIAPGVATISLILSVSPRWRPLGLRSLVFALLGGVVCLLLWLGAYVAFADPQVIDWHVPLGAFGAGYSFGGIAVFLWQAARRVLSNSAPHRDGREASHFGQQSSAPARGRER